MKRSSYSERDYTFGQMLLTLRTSIGLTQAELAHLLGVSLRAVAGWETGSAYPKTDHLKAFLTLCVQRRAFPAGHEAEQIRALWKAAHQKVLLDELWLHGLLGTQRPPLAGVAPGMVEQTSDGDQTRATPALGPRVDWGDALHVPSFYGREEELALLSRWVVEERCRVVSVLGMGGIGKSALAVTLMHREVRQFEAVIWRSLRDAPRCSALVEECLQVLAPQRLPDLSDSLEGRLRLLMEQFRARRVLLVLDNLEMLLEEGEGTGRMRAGLEGYVRLLQRIGETAHQSCLLLTSREKSADLVPLEGSRSPVRALRLAGLDGHAGAQLLAEKDVVGSLHDRVRLVEVYRGNPLALKIVAQTIVELFGGDLAPFLEQGEVVFGGVRELLDEQYARLTDLEQTVLCWLAIVREPVTLGELRALLVAPKPTEKLLEAVDGLRRRSLIESGQHPGSFTLQSVVLEYVTTRLVAEVSREIEQGRLARLIAYGLCQAQAKEYVRAIQERLLVVPLLSRLQSTYQVQADLEARFLWLLDHLRGRAQDSQGYGPANLVALLREQRGHLRGLDLSHLSLRGAHLQDVEMQDATLAEATLQECVFSGTFDAVSAVAISKSGQYWAAASRRGEVRLWEEGGQTLSRVWQAHTDRIRALTFSPDGRQLVTGSWDNTVKLWDVENGALLWSDSQASSIPSVAFAPDGSLLAMSGENVGKIHLWDLRSDTLLETLSHPHPVSAVAWSPKGRLLASGDFDGGIRVWELHTTGPAICIRAFSGHTNWVMGLAFAPDGSLLASGSRDGTVKLWDVASGRLRQTLAGHTDGMNRVAWSPDGRTLASGSRDTTIRLWDVEEGSARAVLQGHTAEVYGLAFTPDSRSLLSGSDDGTLRLWDVESSQCLRIMRGYVSSLFGIDWSPDGTQLASGGSDALVTVWDMTGARPPRVLRGHRGVVSAVGWSPNGRLLASSGWDNTIRLWNPTSGACVERHQDPDHPDTVFFAMAWSPDGQQLACGTNLQGVHVWKVTAGSHWGVGRQLPTRIRRVAWSPDGTRLVGAGDDGIVYVWDASDGTQQQRLAGHHGTVRSVAWSPDGRRLASAGGGREGGELFVWEAYSGERVRSLEEHPGVAFAVVWCPSGEMLVSGGSDGMLRWWEVQSGECVRVREAHQGTVQSLKVSPEGSRLASCGDDGAIRLWDLESGEPLQTLRRDRPYERLDISGVQGLTEAQRASLRALGAIEEGEGLLKE